MSTVSHPPALSPTASASKLRTISHTLDAQVAERLRYFAFAHRLSESSVIEHALAMFFQSGSEQELAWVLRGAGYGLRRKTG